MSRGDILARDDFVLSSTFLSSDLPEAWTWSGDTDAEYAVAGRSTGVPCHAESRCYWEATEPNVVTREFNGGRKAYPSCAGHDRNPDSKAAQMVSPSSSSMTRGSLKGRMPRMSPIVMFPRINAGVSEFT